VKPFRDSCHFSCFSRAWELWARPVGRFFVAQLAFKSALSPVGVLHRLHSLVKLETSRRVVLAARDSLGIYAAFDTAGRVVAHGARIWRDDVSGTALTDVLPALVGKQIPASGIAMLYSGRPTAEGRYVVLQWGLLCSLEGS
jgi:hypothetical protein